MKNIVGMVEVEAGTVLAICSYRSCVFVLLPDGCFYILKWMNFIKTEDVIYSL